MPKAWITYLEIKDEFSAKNKSRSNIGTYATKLAWAETMVAISLLGPTPREILSARLALMVSIEINNNNKAKKPAYNEVIIIFYSFFWGVGEA